MSKVVLFEDTSDVNVELIVSLWYINKWKGLHKTLAFTEIYFNVFMNAGGEWYLTDSNLFHFFVTFQVKLTVQGSLNCKYFNLLSLRAISRILLISKPNNTCQMIFWKLKKLNVVVQP